MRPSSCKTTVRLAETSSTSYSQVFVSQLRRRYLYQPCGADLQRRVYENIEQTIS